MVYSLALCLDVAVKDLSNMFHGVYIIYGSRDNVNIILEFGFCAAHQKTEVIFEAPALFLAFGNDHSIV